MRNNRRGFTMLESLVSIAASSVLVVGLGLGLSITSKTFTLVANTGTADRATSAGVIWWLDHARHAGRLTRTDKTAATARSIPATHAEIESQETIVWDGTLGTPLTASRDNAAPSVLPGSIDAFAINIRSRPRAGSGFANLLPVVKPDEQSVHVSGLLFSRSYDEVILTMVQDDDTFADPPLTAADLPTGWNIVRADRFMIWLRGRETNGRTRFNFNVNVIGDHQIRSVVRSNGSVIHTSGGK